MQWSERRIIDVTGEICPHPVLIVRRQLEDLDPGEEFTVVGDYPPAERNITRSCFKHGHHVEQLALDGGDQGGLFALRIVVGLGDDADQLAGGRTLEESSLNDPEQP